MTRRRAQSDRGVSTVVDVALCLLLVSASVVVLVGVGGPTEPVDTTAADHAATLLTGTTATANYSLAPGARRADQSLVPFPQTAGTAFDRTAHGSVAQLLARAAVANATIAGTPISHASDDFEVAVSNATRVRLDPISQDWQVVSLWRPTPGDSVRGQITVGADPPPRAAVSTAVVRVRVGDSRRVGTGDASHSFDTLAAETAADTLRVLYPPQQSHLALLGDYPTDRLTTYRYRRVAGLLGVDLAGTVAEADAARANQRLARGLAPRLAPTLRDRFDSPRTARAAVDRRVGTVLVVVRTWSA
ncbi:DUF7284 family protein [Haloarchaeobius sp. DFWS5]|uniref:DUF7284 family protein n=1 Tax=Haloarchaeobius sp. DFWS5 TaxID=3446114 RepID=UPI003EBAA1BF